MPFVEAIVQGVSRLSNVLAEAMKTKANKDTHLYHSNKPSFGTKRKQLKFNKTICWLKQCQNQTTIPSATTDLYHSNKSWVSFCSMTDIAITNTYCNNCCF